MTGRLARASTTTRCHHTKSHEKAGNSSGSRHAAAEWVSGGGTTAQPQACPREFATQ